MSSFPPVSLSRPSLRSRLESYYSLIAPDAVADQEKWKKNFEMIYTKYGGTVEGETKLATKLAKKYGNQVLLLIAPPHRSMQRQLKGVVSKTEALQASYMHDESHYEIDESRRGSKVLDFTSARFDATYALDAPLGEVMASNPTIFSETAKRLDNISKFRVDLPECDPLRLDPTSMHRNTSTSKKCNESTPNIDGEPMKKISMFLSMASQYENKNSGPLSLLYSIVANRQRARVMVRYVDCIRGTLTGYLFAFDKHFNMLLRDVEEVYSGRVSRNLEAVEYSSITDDDYKSGETRAPSKSKLEAQRRKCYPPDGSGGPGPAVKQRYFHQLLVRGDNVVMVWRAEAERSTHPRTNMSPSHSLYAKTDPDVRRDQTHSIGTPGSLYYALKRWENQQGQKRNS